MSQSTPTAAPKRKVMGRMDAASSDSPSNSITPNARPRIVRSQHAYSSPSLSNNVTPTATRPAPGTGRARVDMSAFASPSSVASSPAMSPSASGRPTSASSAGSSTISARLSAASPSVRSTPTFHGRSGSTVGVGASVSSYRLNEARIDVSSDFNLGSIRSPQMRARNGSVDLSGGGSPAVASPSTRVSAASSQLSSSMSVRSPVPRPDQSPFQKPSTPSASVRPAPSMSARNLLSPQRSQDKLEPAARISVNRPSSPNKPPTSPAPSSTTFAQPTSPAKPHNYARSSDPIVPGRQTSMTSAGSMAVPNGDVTRSHGLTNGAALPADEQALYAISPTDSWPSAAAGSVNRMEPGSAMTTGRAGLRPAPPLQRASMPSSFMDLASVSATGTSSRPDLNQRASFASSTFSTHSSVSQPLSPSSETPRSPSETGEAEEARIHRKLLDLEITNKSLLAINSALEVTKLKQAKEIRELKRRLRDGRGLPGTGGGAARESNGSVGLSEEDFSESEDEDLIGVREDPELEAAHQRCKSLIDAMVERARNAILAEYEEEKGSGRGKVLHPAEVEELQRGSDEEEEGDEDRVDATMDTDVMDASVTFDTDADQSALPDSSTFDADDSVAGLIPSDSVDSRTSTVDEAASSQDKLLNDQAANVHALLPGDVSID
ncbi:hypothetical protein PHSY_002829 [Pseudozyma hubeiensis SY62]|uniref:Uncharacterized protein n=1 Tax=Pseudozyma hubeiensis (strain SY62) TaxID=1305764 RepID=R9P1Z8_PSEHS|nr:hypothetical protein PHSY_002829 [Pseudozyma hubeiensis SY62]GAC95254.1 hypothetical protein PHSY_002829 [Pseudozyma hubeiensis SY62]